jgi:phage tail tape-measure protein
LPADYFTFNFQECAMAVAKCPRCGGTNVDKRNYAKKAGTAAGAVAGVAGTFAGAEGGAAVGAAIGSVIPGFGTVVGGVLGALGGLAAGALIGSKAGEIVDEHLLDNYKCMDCDHTFSL